MVGQNANDFSYDPNHRRFHCPLIFSHRPIIRQLTRENYLSYRQGHPKDLYTSPTQMTQSRNGHWIRVLAVSECDLRASFSELTCPLIRQNADPSSVNTATALPEPTNMELLRHLLRRCTNLQQLRLSGDYSYHRQVESWKMIVRTALPGTLTDLSISLTSSDIVNMTSFPPILFSQCPSGLRTLRLHINYSTHWGYRAIVEKVVEEEVVGEDESLPLLKEVRIIRQDEREYIKTYPSSWSRILGRCTNLETLVVTAIDQAWIPALESCSLLRNLEIVASCKDSPRSLTTALKTGLPNLDNIYINDRAGRTSDEDKAAMLSAGRKGWRSINLQHAGHLTVEAVSRHCTTLETLSLRKATGLTSAHMVQILSSSPKLKSFTTLVEDDYTGSWTNEEETHISAGDFIDADSLSDSLKPWACESTLKMLRAKISGIPRPDITQTLSGHPLEEGMVLQEIYPGQSQDIQGRVYERLARFTRMERLELGNEDRGVYSSYQSLERTFDRAEQAADGGHQYNCLDMSLQNGLWRLGGLKELQELGVKRMSTLIGPEEEQWMKEHWPKIKNITKLRTYLRTTSAL